MQRLIIEIDSAIKAKELQPMLSELRFVKKVISVDDMQGLPQSVFENEDAFFTEMDRRVEDLESGAVTGISIEELENEARKRTSKRA